MLTRTTDLPGVLLLEPKVFEDARGFFLETYRADRLREAGISDNFVQANQSHSVRGTLRGLHYQLVHPQAKLCRVAHGEVVDVAVDIRRGSPTFGKAFQVILSAENRLQIYVPAGFAHGFQVLSDSADFLYQCSDFYHPEDEHGILWSDPALRLDWPLREPLLSARDSAYPCLAAVAPEHLPVYRPARSAAMPDGPGSRA
ncbi:MAG: dTDP-4-dehydrorhamnose 3,5-epimerase [Acidobacteriota bacterium]|nr:dTDP-4-dehydrorhamnose 3,5-epimerase [Acidobacteriota bacterium]